LWSQWANFVAIGGVGEANPAGVGHRVEQISQPTIDTVHHACAEQIAEPRTPDKATGEILWYGTPAGLVSLRL
jgi:hypothetical protein